MNLHQQFLKLAKEKQKITYEMLSLLPEIYKSGIFKKYAHTIYGYALQYGQIPESVVRKTLNLEEKIAAKPILKSAIAEVGIHKVAMVESIVTSENEEVIVEKIKNMSSAAIQAMAKELRQSNSFKTISLDLSTDAQKIFSTVKKFLNISELSDQKAFEQILEFVLLQKNTLNRPQVISSTTRHIPDKVKDAVKDEYDNKCSYPNCTNKDTSLHHLVRYAESKNHQKIVPLCKVHHEFMHNSLVPNELAPPHLWKLSPQKTTNITDLKYQKFRS